jgi:DNA-binding MarR family transcriptional regulator
MDRKQLTKRGPRSVTEGPGKYQPECVCVNLRRAARAMSQLYDDALAASGVKITQFSLLRAIARNEPAPINVLAEELELDRTTLARNLQPLERDDLIALAAGSDKRVVEVRLTAAGRAAIERALPLWQQAQRDVAARLGSKRVGQLREIAQRATSVAKE